MHATKMHLYAFQWTVTLKLLAILTHIIMLLHMLFKYVVCRRKTNTRVKNENYDTHNLLVFIVSFFLSSSNNLIK